MKGKSKYSADEKLNAVREYLDGRNSKNAISKRLGIRWTTFDCWVRNYESMGASVFYLTSQKGYSKEHKKRAVEAYLSGEGSLTEICKRFKIRSETQLRRWIKKYNSHEELKASGKGGGKTIMTEGRKTDIKERIDIAAYCIEHDHNYTEAAEKYKVSYQQARSYTVKYEEGGIDALQDRRGKRKSADQLTEIERLKAELKMEQAKRRRAEMEVKFLKKLEEIERRRL